MFGEMKYLQILKKSTFSPPIYLLQMEKIWRNSKGYKTLKGLMILIKCV